MNKESQPQSNQSKSISEDNQNASPEKTAHKILNLFKTQENLNPNQSSFTSHQIQKFAAPSKNYQAVSFQEQGFNQLSLEQLTSLARNNSRSQKHQFQSSVCKLYVKRGILNRRINQKRRTQIETAKTQTLNKRRKLIQSNFNCNDDNGLNYFEEQSEKAINNPVAHQMNPSKDEEAMKRRQRILNNLDTIRQKIENVQGSSNPSENCSKQKTGLANNKEQEENEIDDQHNFYENFEELGTGSFGRVIRQLHLPTRKFYAFKELKIEDDEKRERMAKQEFKLLKVIQEANLPNLLQIKDLKRPPNFFARMEYGFGTLYNFLNFCKRKNIMKRWSDNDILTLYFQLWSQLQEFKILKIFHSDIKPSNIIISSEGFFVISDFGVSLLLKKLGRQEISIQGTYDYYMDEIKKVVDEKKWSCEYDPMEQDHFALIKIIKDIILLRNKLDTLEKLFDRANIKNEKDFQLFTTRSSLPIYEKKKEAYHIYLLDQYYLGYTWKEKQEIISHLIEYCHFDQINKWLQKKLEEEKYAQPHGYIYLCFLKAQTLVPQEKYQEALKYYQECEEILTKFKHQIDPKYSRRLYSEMGAAAVSNYDFELARIYIDKSFKMKLQDGIPTIELAQDYYNLAAIEYDEGNRENAVKNCEDGLKLFESKNINICFLDLQNFLGLSLEGLGRYDQAYEILQDLYKKLCPIYGKTHSKISGVLNNIALILDNTGNPKDALSYNQKSLQINKELFLKGNKRFAYSLINMAVCYAYLNELEEALQCACEGVQIIEYSKNKDPYVFVVMITIAEICVVCKKYESAKKCLQIYLNSYDQMSVLKDKIFLQKCFINWDYYVQKRKGLELALEKYQKRMAYLALNPQAQPIEAFIHQRFAIIEILRKNYKIGLYYLEKAHEIIDKNVFFFSGSEIELHQFFESNNSLKTASRKDLREFCEEYYEKCKSSLIIASEIHV